MKYVGYDFSFDETGIELDVALNIANLGWKEGDQFEFKIINGTPWITKLNATTQTPKAVPLEERTFGTLIQ
jgi:hypothetical protein